MSPDRPILNGANGERSAKQLWIVAAAAALIVLGSYSGSLSADFIWDDRKLIVEDAEIHSLSGLPTVFSRDFFSAGPKHERYGYYRPLITLSYMLEYALVGPTPWLYHATNIAWHLSVTLLVFTLCRRLSGGGLWGPMVACALFASHPVHSESVSWISGRTDVVCTAFALAALLLAMSYLDRPATALRSLALVLWSSALFALAIFTKEVALAIPLVAGAYAALGRTKRAALRESWPLAAGYALVLGIYLVMRVGVADVEVVSRPEGHSVLAALLTFPKALAIYLGKLLLPLELEAYMVVPYDRSPFSALGILGLAILGVSGWWVARWRLPRPGAAFLLAAFFASFVPLMNLVPIKSPVDMGFTMAERFLYLPSVFFCALIGLGVEGLALRTGIRRAVLLITALVVLAFGVRTQVRALDYRSNVEFFAKAYAQHPQALLLASAYGSSLRRAGQVDHAIAILEAAALRASTYGNYLRRAGEIDQAISIMERALRELPNVETNAHLVNNLAIAYATRGRFEEALSVLRTAEALYPGLSTTAKNLGGVYWLMGDHRSARRYLDAALEADPGGDDARSMRATSRIELGDLDGAREDLERLRRDGVANADLYVKLGHAYRATKRPREAIAVLEVALELGAGSDLPTRMLLGTLRGQIGDLSGALLHLGAAHRQAPLAIDPAGAYATALVRTGRRAEAVEMMQGFVTAHPDSARPLLIMANLELASGNLDSARSWLERARVLAPASQEVELVEAHLARTKSSDPAPAVP